MKKKLGSRLLAWALCMCMLAVYAPTAGAAENEMVTFHVTISGSGQFTIKSLRMDWSTVSLTTIDQYQFTNDTTATLKAVDYSESAGAFSFEPSPASGYMLSEISVDGTKISNITSAQYYTLGSEHNVQVTFIEKVDRTITFNYNDSLGKILYNGEEVASGDTKTVTLNSKIKLEAVPNTGEDVVFDKWLEDGKETTTTATKTFTIQKDITLGAKFAGYDAVAGYTPNESVMEVATLSVYPWTAQYNVVQSEAGTKYVRSFLRVKVKGSGILHLDYETPGGTLYYNVGTMLTNSNYSKEGTLLDAGSDKTLIISAASDDTETNVYFAYYTGSKLAPAKISNLHFAQGSVRLAVRSDSDAGSVTVHAGSESVTGEANIPLGTSVTATAIPQSGMRFYGWVENDKLLSLDRTVAFALQNATELKAVFASPEYYAARIDGRFYDSLETAVGNAQSGETVILLNNVTINADITIPSGVTLLAPYADDKTEVNGQTSKHPYANSSSPVGNAVTSNFMTPPNEQVLYTLSLGPNAKLTVTKDSKLVIGGMVGSCNGGNSTGFGGQTVGAHSNLSLADGSSVIVENGGVLSSTGYVTGNGSISVERGGAVYEPFVCCEFLGGSYMAVAATQNNVSPFNQYAMVNVQSRMFLESGGQLYGYCDLYASSTHNKTTAKIIDTNNALINMADSPNASLTITYDAAKTLSNEHSNIGRTTMTFRGGAATGPLELKLLSIVTVSTEHVLFPLPYNYEIILADGDYRIDTKLKILPGAELTVQKDATLSVSNQLAVYDGFQPQQYSGGPKYPENQILSLNNFAETGTLTVDGTMLILPGASFGGTVYSKGEGKILMDPAALVSITSSEGALKGQKHSFGSALTMTNKTDRTLTANLTSSEDRIIMIEPGGRYISQRVDPAVPIQSQSYTYQKFSGDSTNPVFTNETVSYRNTPTTNGVWARYYAVSFSGTDTTLEKTENSQLLESEAPKDFPVKNGYTAAGWDAAFPITVTSDLTLEPKYIPNTYTVSFDPNGGTGTMEQQTFTYDATQALAPNAFQRENYYFAGWSDTADGETKYANGEAVNNLTATANGVVTLYAVWRDHFVVTFEGTDATLRRAPNGTVAETDAPAVPAKTGYTAAGWDASFPLTVNGDLTIKPRYTANSYTVQFDVNRGEGAMEAQSFTYDAAQPLTANAFTRNGYHFTGWSTAADGDKLYADKAEVINLTAEAGGAVTLYARWERDTSSGGSGGGGGASTPDKPKEQTTVSPDGTKTTTVTDEKNGTTTKIITASDGSTETVKTQKDGTVESKTELADGTKAEATVKPDGNAEVSATVPAKAIPQDQPLSIETPAGSITLPPETLSTVANAKELSLSVSVTPAANDSAGNVATIRLSVKADGKAVTGLGSITLRVPVGKLLIPDTRTPLADGKTAASVQVTQPSLIVRADGTLLPGAYVTGDTLVVTLTGDATLTLSENAKDFSDVPADHWAHTAVAFATARELFSGTGEHTFSPGSDMTRAMLMTVLARLDGQNVSGGATYYEKAMVWAQSAGISDGKNALSPITREQLAAMLYRYAGSPAVNDAALSFADADQASSYAGSALRWAVQEGLLTGKPGGLLDPKASATRAEVSAILMRYLVQ